jgi:hypothetical protein
MVKSLLLNEPLKWYNLLMENEKIPSQPIPDTSPQGEVSAPVVTDQPVETVVLTPTAQIPADEPLGSSAPSPVEQSTDPVSSVPDSVPAPVSAEPIPSPVPHTNIIRELLAKARAKIQSRKRVKLDKVMTLFAKRTQITNDEVEKLLHVSDATATRYLEILEKENKIKQSGKTGKYTHYEKI